MIYGTLTDAEAVCKAVESDVHDVICQLYADSTGKKCRWHDISLPLPSGSYLRIPDEYSDGDVFPYDGVRLAVAKGQMEIAYTVGSFMVAFRSAASMPDQCISIGAGCDAPAVTKEEAARMMKALAGSPAGIDGFQRVSVDLPDDDCPYDIWSKELDCGLTINVDEEQEAWVQASGKMEGMYATVYDVVSASSDGNAITIRTDKCFFILPIGGGAE